MNWRPSVFDAMKQSLKTLYQHLTHTFIRRVSCAWSVICLLMHQAFMNTTICRIVNFIITLNEVVCVPTVSSLLMDDALRL